MEASFNINITGLSIFWQVVILSNRDPEFAEMYYRMAIEFLKRMEEK